MLTTTDGNATMVTFVTVVIKDASTERLNSNGAPETNFTTTKTVKKTAPSDKCSPAEAIESHSSGAAVQRALSAAQVRSLETDRFFDR